MNKIQFEELAIRYFTGDLDSEGILLLEDEIRQSKEAKKIVEAQACCMRTHCKSRCLR